MSKSQPTKMSRKVLAAITALSVLMLCFTAQHVHSTLAKWTDSEWVSAQPNTIQTLNCIEPVPANQLATRAESQFLSGTAFELETSSVVGIAGTKVTNNGMRVLVQPQSATADAGHPDAYMNPLDIQLLNSSLLNLQLPMQLNLDTPTGALKQYAQALSSGKSYAASGLISDSGAIDLSQNPVPNSGIAKISLNDLLNAVGLNLGDLVGNVTGATVTLGAAASTASLEGCGFLWGSNPNAAQRSYLFAGLKTEIWSILVEQISGAAQTRFSSITDTAVNIATNQVVTNALKNAINGIVNPLLNNTIVGVGEIQIDTLTASVNSQLVSNLVFSNISDSSGIVSIKPLSGLVEVNTNALLGKTWNTDANTYLNTLPPNTNIIADERVLETLTTALNSALNSWISNINVALNNIINVIYVTASIKVQLTVSVLGIGLLNLGHIAINTAGTLGNLLNGGAADSTVTPLLDIPLLTTLGLASTVNSIVATLLQPLKDGVNPIVGAAVNGAFSALRTLSGATTEISASLARAVSGIYRALFLEGIIALTINAQNNTSHSQSEPVDWQGIPHGRFDVAAVRIGVLNTASQSSIALYLARSSVGKTCKISEASSFCPGY